MYIFLRYSDEQVLCSHFKEFGLVMIETVHANYVDYANKFALLKKRHVDSLNINCCAEQHIQHYTDLLEGVGR